MSNSPKKWNRAHLSVNPEAARRRAETFMQVAAMEDPEMRAALSDPNGSILLHSGVAIGIAAVLEEIKAQA
jgi:hypothetical protein